MNNFKVGDKARLVYIRNSGDPFWIKGAVVTVEKIEFGFNEIYNLNYHAEVSLKSGHTGEVLFEQLEPIIIEPSTWEKIQEITKWNPTKEYETV